MQARTRNNGGVDTPPMRVPRTKTAHGGFSRLQEQQQGMAVSWCDLPSDVYGQILRRLPSRGDGIRLGAVCRHWRVSARQHVLRVCQILPMRVARTPRGTHVAHVRGFSRLQERHCGGFVDSPAFAVGGLHWAIRFYPSSGDGHVGASVVLLTQGAVARAYVGLLFVDQTTGLADTVVFWDEHRTLFDAESADSCARGTGKVAVRSELKKGSRFIRGDCLKIECVLDDVCRERRLK